MIKKSVFENELIAGMQYELRAHDKKQGINNLVKAAEYLHSAMEMLEEIGYTKNADQILQILTKVATDTNLNKHKDHHTHGLTPEKMVENLKQHGLVFNLVDDTKADDDLLEADVGDKALEVSDDDVFGRTFEDAD